jgi:ribonuclease P protein component
VPGGVQRISDRATFLAFRHADRQGRCGPVRVVHLPSADGPVRVAYAVGRRIGGAVVRNRVRRRLRAVVTACAADGILRPGAYLVVAAPGIERLDHGELVATVRTAMTRAIRRPNGPS